MYLDASTSLGRKVLKAYIERGIRKLEHSLTISILSVQYTPSGYLSILLCLHLPPTYRARPSTLEVEITRSQASPRTLQKPNTPIVSYLDYRFQPQSTKVSKRISIQPHNAGALAIPQQLIIYELLLINAVTSSERGPISQLCKSYKS